METALLLAAATGLLTALGSLESWLHRRNLRRIPIRVHVNGTRGKSSVTRLIAAGLRAGGVRTCAKTTGTLARMIFPDGSERPVFRRYRANVIEQVRIVRRAVAERAEALVLECMAVQPLLQSLCELRIVQSTHGVITNARPDHLDVMGPTPRDVALALAGTTPCHGKLFTAEQVYHDVFATACRDRHSTLIRVADEEIDAIGWDEMGRFSYIEHPENVALALRVCADLGIDRAVALRGMWAAQPDPGVMTMHHVCQRGRDILFVNGFAANDPQSTENNWNLAVRLAPEVERRIAVFNCRADRVDRSLQLAEMCASWNTADHYLVIGSGTAAFARRALALGLSPLRLTIADQHSADDVFDEIVALAGRSALVVGMGNIAGVGMELLERFRRCRPPLDPRPSRAAALQEAA